MCVQPVICCLLIGCLLIALDAHKVSRNGYGPGTKAQKLLGPWPGSSWLLGIARWSRAHIYVAEHMYIKGAINRQSRIGNR